jgi:hypothetical protein
MNNYKQHEIVWLSNLFRSFRNYTYQIFLMGIFAQIGVQIAFKKMVWSGAYGESLIALVGYYAVCIGFGIYAPVLVAKTTERVGWKPMKTVLGVR